MYLNQIQDLYNIKVNVHSIQFKFNIRPLCPDNIHSHPLLTHSVRLIHETSHYTASTIRKFRSLAHPTHTNPSFAICIFISLYLFKLRVVVSLGCRKNFLIKSHFSSPHKQILIPLNVYYQLRHPNLSLSTYETCIASLQNDRNKFSSNFHFHLCVNGI